MIKIEFTEDQFKVLLKTVYLGNWMVNADRLPDDRDEEFDDLTGLIFNVAVQAGFDELAEDHGEEGVIPTSEFEEEMSPILDEYNDHTFWDELIGRLGTRDFLEAFGEESVQMMSLKELLDKQKPFLEKYENEFTHNGIMNLTLGDEES